MGGLHGKTLALVGVGGIGRAVAERALPFGMRVRAQRRTRAPSPLAGVEMAPSLADLAATADHLVLALPATGATRGIVDDAPASDDAQPVAVGCSTCICRWRSLR